MFIKQTRRKTTKTLLLRREEFLVINCKILFRFGSSVCNIIHADFIILFNKVQVSVYVESTCVAGWVAVNCINTKKKQIFKSVFH